MNCTDVAIVGGGIVGNVLAKGLLEQTDLSVTLLDAENIQDTVNPLHETRVIALAKRTVNALAEMGVPLTQLQQQNPGYIKHIEVTDKGWLGLTDLHSDEFGIDSFGQVVSLSALTKLVVASLPASSKARYTRVAPIKVEHATQSNDSVTLALSNGEALQAKCVVLADGGRSPLANQLGFSRQQTQYNQTAVVFNVHTASKHDFSAFERFTSQGPLAFLPYESEIDNVRSSGNGFSVVWTLNDDNVQSILQSEKGDFLTALQGAFGYRKGAILRASQPVTYPLSLRYTDLLTAHRCVVVGNAAQALHPIAGQGFNLGLRDILGLIEAFKNASDPGQFRILSAYAKSRHADRKTTILLTDTLVRSFSNAHFPLVLARNFSLLGLGALGTAKRAFVQQTTGYGVGHIASTNQSIGNK